MHEVSPFCAEHGDTEGADSMGDIDESLAALDEAAATLAEARALLRKAEGQVSTAAVRNAWLHIPSLHLHGSHTCICVFIIPHLTHTCVPLNS